MSTTLISKAPINRVSTVKEMLANQNAARQLASVAASHLNPERMMRTIALSISKTPGLAECTPLSLLGAVMTSASLGLIPNTSHGHAYLIPFKDKRRGITEAQLVIGYLGYIQLAHNSGQVASVSADIHYSDDEHWKWRQGACPVLEHELGPQQGEMLHAYAIFTKTNGTSTWVCWPEAKLVAHRDRYSKGYAYDIRRGKKATDQNVNIWLSHPDVARKKTMIRQLAKLMPMASEIPMAASLDGARANYADFALDPSLGLPDPEIIDQVNECDGLNVDEETSRDDQEDSEQSKAAARHTTTSGRGPKRDKAKETDPGDEEDFSRHIEEILGEASDMGAGAADVLDFYGGVVDRMKDNAPDQFRILLEGIAEIENGAGEGGEG